MLEKGVRGGPARMFAALGLLEELLPITDLLPTASLCWARQYLRFVPDWGPADGATDGT